MDNDRLILELIDFKADFDVQDNSFFVSQNDTE